MIASIMIAELGRLMDTTSGMKPASVFDYRLRVSSHVHVPSAESKMVKLCLPSSYGYVND